MVWDNILRKTVESKVVIQGIGGEGLDFICPLDLTCKETWKQFVQEHSNSASSDVEDLQPGEVYIINNSTFNEELCLKDRKGSEKDVNRLKSVFEKLHLSVHLIEDKTKEEIQNEMKKIASKNFEDVSCLVIIVMSHGFEKNKIAAKDVKYSLLDTYLHPIYANRSLYCKPKIFITERCRGPVNTLHLGMNGNSPELLQLHSSVEGYTAYMHSNEGTIFIQCLCDYLEKYGSIWSINRIAETVKEIVKRESFDVVFAELQSTLCSKKEFILNHHIPKSLG